MGVGAEQQEPSRESMAERLMQCGLNMTPDPLSDPCFRVRCVDEAAALDLTREFVSPRTTRGCPSGLHSETENCLPIPEVAARVRRELGLLRSTRSKQKSSTGSDLDRKEYANAACVHLAYLTGLRQQLEVHALEQGLAQLPANQRQIALALWQTIDRATTNRINDGIHAFETWHENFVRLANQPVCKQRAISGYIAAKEVEQMLVGSLVTLQRTKHDGELLKFAVLKAVSLRTAQGGILDHSSNICEMLRHVEAPSSVPSQLTQHRWEQLRQYDRPATQRDSKVTTIDTAGLSPEQRTALANQIVPLITESLTGGGRFNSAENTVELFSAALALRGTRFHGIFSDSGELKGAAVAHLREFPEKYRCLAQQYAGSLRPGFIRFIAISTELQGSAAYDNLNHRMILDSSGAVDFLVGRWRIGLDANVKGGRHVKAKHHPLGDVERSDTGRLFQHLIVPINHYLREAINFIVPKGYHPPHHRGMCAKIMGSSATDEESYETPLFPHLLTELVDSNLAACVRDDHGDLDELYREHPEGLNPKHLLIRFRPRESLSPLQ